MINQFEQWLHLRGGNPAAELVLALRQCDGARVQCLLLVRDDFWLAMSRFMQALEVRVVEGENSRLADLFDKRHARKVLAALGVAFGALSETTRTKERDLFLSQAVEGLSHDGKVVPVRLALFAEMVKGKPWTPSALRDIGGAEGVGVAFLEETFSSSSAPLHHRLHQKAAQAVLAALLPEAGSDIRGHMRSRDELLEAVEASGCRTSPGQFDELMALLDHELRLVTPADASGEQGAELLRECPGSEEAAAPNSQLPARSFKFYQLTHDYLVHSLREWLTRKQRATRRGRAERRLADFTALWKSKPENRRLPALLEYLQIRFHTSPRSWRDAERKMMRSAAQYHSVRTAVALAAGTLIAFVSIRPVANYFDRPNQLYNMVYRVRADEVPAAIDEIDKSGYLSRLAPRFKQDLEDAQKSGDETRGLRASLALVRDDADQRDFLYSRLVAAARQEADTIRGELLKREQRQPTSELEAEIKAPITEDSSDAKKKAIAARKTNAAIALMRLGQYDSAWPLLKRSSDETVRSCMIHWCPQFGVDCRTIYRQWRVEKDVGARAALLLLLGQFPSAALPDDEHQQLVGQAASVFENEPDAGLHAAAQWLLLQWKCGETVNAAIARLKKDEPRRRRRRIRETALVRQPRGPDLRGRRCARAVSDGFSRKRARAGRDHRNAAPAYRQPALRHRRQPRRRPTIPALYRKQSRLDGEQVEGFAGKRRCAANQRDVV